MIIKNKLALITGGSSGIGKSIAFELAKKGYDLLIVSNKQNELESSKKDLEIEYPITCHTYFADLSLESAAQDVYSYCMEKQFEIEFLVNNAGILIFSELHETKDGLANRILMLHMYTPTILCRLFSKDMILRKKGFILNISSISAVMPFPCISLYGPTKTFIRAFSKAIRIELSGHNIQVCCVMPGTTESALYDPQKVNFDFAKRIGIMTDSTFVAKHAINATFANKGEVIPGWINKLSVATVPYIPRFFIQYLYSGTNLVTRFKKILD
ncbi:MAG: SDR family NAD(P)-dependent oxidoreductase [Bacteroidota bacterium]